MSLYLQVRFPTHKFESPIVFVVHKSLTGYPWVQYIDTQVFYTQVRFPTHKFESRAVRDIIMFDNQRGGATMKEILKIRLFIGCTWHHYVWQPKGRGYHERNFFENKTVDFFGYLKRTLSAKAKVNAKRPRLTYGKENGPDHDKRFQ